MSITIQQAIEAVIASVPGARRNTLARAICPRQRA